VDAIKVRVDAGQHWVSDILDLLAENERLRAELHQIDHALDRRDALSGIDHRIDKILALLRVAAASDPKAELVKATSDLSALRLALAGIRTEMETESRASRGFRVDEWIATLAHLEQE
jgi:hypothetical protein